MQFPVIFIPSHLHKGRCPYWGVHVTQHTKTLIWRGFFSLAFVKYSCTLGYRSFTSQLNPALPSPSSLALILTLTANHGIHNESVSFHKTILSFFLSPRFSLQLWVRVWSTEGRAGLSREPTSREIRYSFTRESAAHVLSRPLTYRLLYKSITRAQCPPLGLGTDSPLPIGSQSEREPTYPDSMEQLLMPHYSTWYYQNNLVFLLWQCSWHKRKYFNDLSRDGTLHLFPIRHGLLWHSCNT